MTRFNGVRRWLVTASVAFLAVCASFGATDRKFSTPTSLQAEAQTLVNILERAHYNRDAVRSTDYKDVIPDYMGELDGQRLFFLGTDKTKFLEDWGKSVYYNTAFLGNIDPAYRIFEVYQTRVENRINWIFEELKKDFDLSTNETYRADRSKSEWPSNAAAADELWRRRLKYELVAEILNKKSPDEAKTALHKRYERMLKNLGDIEGNDLAELYLSTIAHLYDPHSTYFSAATY
jgi:carboxyl-terminal processing protease